jgi:hypothetical protein
MRPVVTFRGVRLAEALDTLLHGSGLGTYFYRNEAVVIAPPGLMGTDYTEGYYAALQRMQGAPPPDSVEGVVLRTGGLAELAADGMVRLSGVVADRQSGELLGRTVLVWVGTERRVVETDGRGAFSLSLPAGVWELRAERLGFEPYQAKVYAWGDGMLEVRLMAAATLLTETVVRAQSADARLRNNQVSTVTLDPREIRKLPTLMGEADVVRSLLLLTGVTSVGEGAAGFNVRGGETDQNLMLQDEMILFNSSHALGFFSTYNTDLVQNIELHKSILPAGFGGRLSSVLDVRLRDGDMERWKVQGGLGPVSGRLSVEGPVVRGKSSVLGGFRGSFSDWILGLTRVPALRRSAVSFYDLNLRYTHRLGANRSLTATVYGANDRFLYDAAFGFDYQTLGAQATYKRFWGEHGVSRLTAVVSDYRSRQRNYSGLNGGTLETGIRYFKLKEHVTFRRGRSWVMDGGMESILYGTQPGRQAPLGEASVLKSVRLSSEQGVEVGLFGQVVWEPGAALSVQAGFRFNHFRLLGPYTSYAYDGDIRPENLMDSTFYGGWSTVTAYNSPEPRLSVRYRIGARHAIKGGYSRTSQFVNQLFNTDSPTPTSQYQLSTPYLEPFRAHNAALGYFATTERNRWEYAAEVFYRGVDRLWDYRDFARLVANKNLETEIRQGRGRAYGLELSARTNRPLYNGQVGYTFSRATRRIEGINRGMAYPSNFDKPHVLNLVFNYQPSLRHKWTFLFTYSTGRPTTAPVTSYRLNNNIIVPIYSPRNQVRIPDYHRLDISYTIGTGYNKHKTLRSSWNFSLYNVYARRNAFAVFYRQSAFQQPVANRLAILGTVFPAITINIETI